MPSPSKNGAGEPAPFAQRPKKPATFLDAQLAKPTSAISAAAPTIAVTAVVVLRPSKMPEKSIALLLGFGAGYRKKFATRPAIRATTNQPITTPADARITRVDIAADDFLGQWPVQWAIDRYNEGGFDRRGQRPKARLIDDMGNRTGKTFYVGSRKSEQQLRVYEKGREQGDMASEWVRYEGEFHASNRRELPLEMLTDPAPYLVGSYPILDFVDGIGQRLRIATEKLLANCARAVMHFRRQYGPMINAMLHASGGDEATLSRLIVGTARAKLPPWCPRPEDAAQLLTAILFAPSGHIDSPESRA